MNENRKLRTLDHKRFIGVAIGLVLLFVGVTIYSNHGFQSGIIFFLGFLMVPMGLIVLGTVLVRIPRYGDET